MVDGDETFTGNMRTRTTSTSASEPCLTQRQSIKDTIIASLASGGRDQGKVFIKLHSFYDRWISVFSWKRRGLCRR